MSTSSNEVVITSSTARRRQREWVSLALSGRRGLVMTVIVMSAALLLATCSRPSGDGTGASKPAGATTIGVSPSAGTGSTSTTDALSSAATLPKDYAPPSTRPPKPGFERFCARMATYIADVTPITTSLKAIASVTTTSPRIESEDGQVTDEQRELVRLSTEFLETTKAAFADLAGLAPPEVSGEIAELNRQLQPVTSINQLSIETLRLTATRRWLPDNCGFSLEDLHGVLAPG